MRIVIAGDFAPHARIADLIKEKRFSNIFHNDIVDIINSSDFSVVNLESPIIDKDCLPISKNGPNLYCDENVLDAINYLGFKSLSLANNHILDYGANGLRKTVQSSQDASIRIMGVGNNLKEAETVHYVQINTKKIAFICCCENEFSIATEFSPGANPINPISQYYAIKEARDRADFVILIVHGGCENYQLPTRRMQEIYRFFIDVGANVVINHHQHCYSGYENYNNGFIFYGLGNFCFDWDGKRNSPWNEGFLLQLNIEDKITFDIIPYVQCDTTPSIQILYNEEYNEFLKRINELNKIILCPTALECSYTEHCRQLEKQYSIIASGYNNRILQSLLIRGIIKQPNAKWRLLQLYNYINCESHLDRFKRVLTKLLNN